MQIEFFYLKNVKGGIWIEMKSRLPLFVLETFELEILRVESNYRPLSGNAVVRVARVHLLKFAVGVFSLRRTPFQYSSSSGGGKMSGSATLPKRIECVHLCGQFPQEFQSKNRILISGSLCVQLTEEIKWNLEMIEFFFFKWKKSIESSKRKILVGGLTADGPGTCGFSSSQSIEAAGVSLIKVLKLLIGFFVGLFCHL